MTQTAYRPDYSEYLVHFSSNRPAICPEGNEEVVKITKGQSALDRLISILTQKKILASVLPWVSQKAVCFTECPWSSLVEHANQYSPYGVGFKKPRVFAAGGSPVYYVRADHFQKQQWDPHIKTFVTPFWPKYRPKKLKTPGFLNGKDVDYSHEREWRIPHNFTFEYQQVEFVVVDSYEDVAKFLKTLKDSIGRKKFLIMDVYKQIERIWPVHNIQGSLLILLPNQRLHTDAPQRQVFVCSNKRWLAARVSLLRWTA